MDARAFSSSSPGYPTLPRAKAHIHTQNFPHSTDLRWRAACAGTLMRPWAIAKIDHEPSSLCMALLFPDELPIRFATAPLRAEIRKQNPKDTRTHAHAHAHGGQEEAEGGRGRWRLCAVADARTRTDTDAHTIPSQRRGTREREQQQDE